MKRFSKVFELHCKDNLDQATRYLESKSGFIVEIKEFELKRTNLQNNAIWLFCTWIATLFNDSGEMYTTPLGIEIAWDKDLIMDIYWRPLQKILYNKKSTTKLTTSEVSPISEAIIMHMSKKGYDIEFPNWQSFMNKIEAKIISNKYEKI
jgi:hypothetical protein